MSIHMLQTAVSPGRTCSSVLQSGWFFHHNALHCDLRFYLDCFFAGLSNYLMVIRSFKFQIKFITCLRFHNEQLGCLVWGTGPQTKFSY